MLAQAVSIREHSIPARDGYSLEARSYRPSSLPHQTILPVYIHFHGGGFLFGTLSSEDAICSRIASSAGVVVVNVNYRHTPEYTYPTAWNDAEDTLSWVYGHHDLIGGNIAKIVVGGVSAGGQLAAALTQTRHRSQQGSSNPAIVGQVLMIPVLVHVDCHEHQLKMLKGENHSSYKQNENAPILPISRIRLFMDNLKVEHPDINDRKLNPGYATPLEVRGLPPTTVCAAGFDPLRDEALLYGKLLAENG